MIFFINIKIDRYEGVDLCKHLNTKAKVVKLVIEYLDGTKFKNNWYKTIKPSSIILLIKQKLEEKRY